MKFVVVLLVFCLCGLTKSTTTGWWRYTSTSIPSRAIITTTAPRRSTPTTSTMAPPTTTCIYPSCPGCPVGYHVNYSNLRKIVNASGCYYECVCEAYTTTTATATSPKSIRGSFKGFLMKLLHGIQTQAEVMGKLSEGIGEEADMANLAADEATRDIK